MSPGTWHLSRLLAALLSLALCGVAQAVEPPAPMPVQARLNQPVSADFQGVDFVSAMQFLSDHAGVNIFVSDKAKQAARPVSVHLVALPLQRALEHLLTAQGLLYRRDGDALWVATKEEMDAEPMETRVFALRQGAGLTAAFEPFTSSRESVALQPKGIRQLKTLRDTLDAIIPQIGESSIELDERSDSLIVRHSPYHLQQIEVLLAALDVAPQQVLIEARFVEVTLTDTDEWNLDGQLTGNVALTKKTQVDGTRAPGVQLASLGSSLQRGSKIDFTSFTNQTSGNALNFTLEGILSGTQYSAVLHALAQNDRTKTLSAPRVTTLNHQTATIKIVTEYVYATRYQATVTRKDLNSDGDFADTVSGVAETRFINVPQDFITKDLGILLHVTPSIGQDQRTITMALKPEVSDRKTDDSFGGDVTLPRFTSRNLETSVVIDNGDTVVLGGLMKDTNRTTVTRVPGLGRLPLIGKLFRKEDESVERSNLLIFVTAQLVNPAGANLARSDLE
ncbi:MAG: hypothetical protein HY598_03595 [Candidatus Omnitrophica bacterium]|nr:hypothetical protein [Candidatus Omnitrophota bacterium]